MIKSCLPGSRRTCQEACQAVKMEIANPHSMLIRQVGRLAACQAASLPGTRQPGTPGTIKKNHAQEDSTS